MFTSTHSRGEAPQESERSAGPRIEERDVWIEADAQVSLEGSLRTPDPPGGLVIFAHRSGSGRFSPRNRAVAATLNCAGLATLLFDLLTEEEEADPENAFRIALLAERLLAARRWAAAEQALAELPLGLFGASTGAAAALRAAAVADDVAAVVSRGGRPDLADDALPRVSCPTLLIVGGEDHEVLELNRGAAERLGGEHRLEIVAGAGHLFEEPGAIEQVAELAAGWFSSHLISPPR